MHTDMPYTSRREIFIEACCDSLASVAEAKTGGADRIELCHNLPADGLTPGAAMLHEAKRIFPGPVNVLIRSREGNFVYTPEEIDAMTRSIHELSEADGFVIGALTKEGDVDLPAVKRMMEACGGKPVTFHRAFDHVTSPSAALEDIICCGCSRVLTSGCAPTAPEGAQLLRRLHEQAAGRIKILAGGGVTPYNIASLAKEAMPDEIHGSFSRRDSEGKTFTDSNILHLSLIHI